MKNKTFIILTWLHLIFVTFVFLVYLAQHYLYDGRMADGVARFYAMSLFVPNIIGVAVLYVVYVIWFLKNLFNKERIEGFKLHITYNIFFLSGFSLEFFQLKNVTLGDSLFIAAELAAIFLAFVIITEENREENRLRRKYRHFVRRI